MQGQIAWDDGLGSALSAPVDNMGLRNLATALPPQAVDERIYRQWFQIADADRDGRLTGADAVKFFGRSGLQREALSRARPLVLLAAAFHAAFAHCTDVLLTGLGAG